MKTAAHEKPVSASRASTKPSPAGKQQTHRKDRRCVGQSHARIEELKAKLRLIVKPDFSSGRDYYPRMDQGLQGELPGIATEVLAILESRYPATIRLAKNCCNNHDRHE